MQDAARALASYHAQPAALQAVITFVTGPNVLETANLRAAAARGLGISTDPAAAGALVAWTDAKQPPAVRAAAAETRWS